MAISLQKGQGVNLRKDTGYDLARLTIGLGWDIAPAQPAHDLDAIAFVLDAQGKVRNLGKTGTNGRPTLEGGDVVFYNSLVHPSGSIRLSGDNRSGSQGQGDDETITVDLDRLPDSVSAIVFLAAIFKGRERGQSFADVNNAHIRALDAQGRGNLPLPHRRQYRQRRPPRHHLRPRGTRCRRLGIPRHRRICRNRPLC